VVNKHNTVTQQIDRLDSPVDTYTGEKPTVGEQHGSVVLSGSGTVDDPYIIDFPENDPRVATNWSLVKRLWTLLVVALANLCISYCSGTYFTTLAHLILVSLTVVFSYSNHDMLLQKGDSHGQGR